MALMWFGAFPAKSFAKGQSMRVFSAHAARQDFSSVLDAAQSGPVEILRYNRPAAYVLSKEAFGDYVRLRREASLKEMSALLARLDAANDDAADALSRDLMRLVKTIERKNSGA